MRDLWAYVESCPARHSLVMVDACFGGLKARSRSLGLSDVSLSKYLSRTAHEFLTAGGKDEETWEDPSLGHSVFMFSLLKQLSMEAKEPDSTFTAAELYARLKTEVTDKSKGKQTPQMESYGGTEGEVLFVSTTIQPVAPIKTGLPSNAAGIERAPRVIASELCGRGHILFIHKNYAEAERLLQQAIRSTRSSASLIPVLPPSISTTSKTISRRRLTTGRRSISIPRRRRPSSAWRALFKQGKRSDAQVAARKAGELGLKNHLLYRQLGI